jgi:Kdo2-lipid IVA lauroyltransferase/acyltransferase
MMSNKQESVQELINTMAGEPADKRYHEGFLKKIANKLIVSILYLVSLLPFRVLYIVSDFFYIMVRYIFRYRRRVIAENLNFAFPEKTEKEKKQIAGKFYHHFTDLMLETVKLHTISENEMNDRLRIEGLELINKYYSDGKSIIILAMHHNNWEWCSFTQTKGKHQGLLIYNPIRGNQAMEKFVLHSRERWGGKCIPVHQSARAILGFNRKNIPTGLWLGADQTPPASSKFWTIFLNREAPFFSGPEKIAAKTNQPVFFQHVTKTGRGRYLARFIPLIENPATLDQKEILLAYVKKMEEIIRQEPEYYLWSHRRWKHTRPEGIPLTL